MVRVLALFVVIAALGGCGLAETGAAAGGAGSSAAQQAAQARQTEERVRQDIDAAYRQAAQQRDAAEADGK